MYRRYVIACLWVVIVLVTMESTVRADQSQREKFDSLFMIASSGAVIYRDLVEPAKDSVASMGTEIVPLLINKFTTKSARERWTVVHILERIGSPAVPDLIKALNRSEGLIVQRVCWALGTIGDPDAVEPLVAVRHHQRWQVRDQAASALGKIGEAGHGAAAAVIEALVDSIGQIRKAGAVACGKLQLQPACTLLVHLLGDDFYGARFSALEALLLLDTATVMAIVTDSLVLSTNPQQISLACDLLSRLGTDEALELLFEQTFSTDSDRRSQAAVAILRGDPEDRCGFYKFLYERESDRLVLLKMSSVRTIPANEN